MNEIAESTAHASIATIESTTGLSKVRHGRQFAVYRPCGIPARVERITSCLCILFVLESHVDVADQICNIMLVPSPSKERWDIHDQGKHTIIVVIANHHLLDFTIFAHLAPDILVERIEVILDLLRVHLVLRIERRVLIQVRHQNRLRVRWFDMLARATVAMPAGANFVIERAVDFILLRAEDRRQIVRHFVSPGFPSEGLMGDSKAQVRFQKLWQWQD